MNYIATCIQRPAYVSVRVRNIYIIDYNSFNCKWISILIPPNERTDLVSSKATLISDHNNNFLIYLNTQNTKLFQKNTDKSIRMRSYFFFNMPFIIDFSNDMLD